ncbi:EamA family transporter [candidate division KSB1 bacterium]
MKIYHDWRFLSVLSIVLWGLWSFLSKIAGNKLEWGTMLLLFCAGTILVLLIFSPFSFILKPDKTHITGLVAGVTGALGFCFFYMALKKGNASEVIPITSLYIVLAVVLSFIFLKEPVTIKKVLGIISAVAAIFLLSG